VSLLLDHRGRPLGYGLEREPPLSGPSVLALVGDASACALWRTWMPMAALRLRRYPAEWVSQHDPLLGLLELVQTGATKTLLDGFKAIILCRMAWKPGDQHQGERWLGDLRARGHALLYEADDDLFTPWMVRQQKAGIERDKDVEVLEAEARASVWAMQQCDGVTVSTQYLASVVRKLTDKPVEVVPNAIDADWFRWRQREGRRSVPGLTIGWAGGHRPDGDVAAMAEAWGRVARRYPQVTFVVMGSQPWPIWQHVPAPRIKAVPWMGPHDYPKGLVDVDIGCCPLEERPFNRAKTAIKCWEYALSGAAVVASPTVYRHCIEDGANGYLCLDADQWEEALSFLIESEALRRNLASRLRADVLTKWSLQKNLWRWPQAWSRLVDGTAAL
jgi:glycosyltransferase involved in cell wall biosynthesis